jgi:hypothetical protein
LVGARGGCDGERGERENDESMESDGCGHGHGLVSSGR